MKPIFIATPDEVIEQILVQCWIFEARDGDERGARARAERTLERLLSAGLPSSRTGADVRLDPYAASNRLKARAGEAPDEAWGDWQRTTRRNARSLPGDSSRYRVTLRREWHGYAATPGRPVILRLPLPRREGLIGAAQVRLLEPAGGLLDRRDGEGRVELRVDAAAARGPIVAELCMEFLGGDARDTLAPAAPLGAPAGPGDQEWMREKDGYVAPSVPVAALAVELARGCRTTRDFVHAVWRWLIAHLRFGDVHREQLGPDALGSVLEQRLADCVLGSSLLIALCRARGIPARLVSGFLLHPANPGPHSWAEVRLAQDLWVPFDFGSWCYCAGDPDDPEWGNFFRGRVDARLLAEIAPRDFTGWGSAPPPARWYRLERLRGRAMEHTLHRLPDGALFRRDLLTVDLLGAPDAEAAAAVRIP